MNFNISKIIQIIKNNALGLWCPYSIFGETQPLEN